MSRLADILKNEYKTKGVFSGAASAVGKSVREKLDIRNALFGGSGLGSVIGRKIFGKGYSAIGDRDNKVSSASEGLTAGASTILNEININSQVTAKNTLALPSMARDMHLVKQNIIKMVKLQGGTPTTKAGDWFSRQAARESAYESKFGKKNSVNSPSKIEEKKSPGFFGIVGSLISGISSAITTLGTLISGAITTMGNVLAAAIDALALALIGRRIMPGGGGARGGKGKGGKVKPRGRFGLGSLATILGLGYVASDVFGGDSTNPNELNPSTPGQQNESSNKTNWGSVASSGVEAGIGAVGAVSTLSGISSQSKVQGYNSKAKRFTDAGGKFVKAKDIPKGDMLKKFFDFAARVATKGWMGKLASKLALKLGTSIALKAMTFIGGLAVPGAGWFASALALASLALDAYLIYDAIFAPGGILDELEKEDKTSTTSPTLQQQNPSSPAAPGTPPTSTSPTPQAPNTSTSTQTGGGSSGNVGDIGNKKFKDMSLDEQNAFLDRQYAMEGNKPGNLAHDLNNPGAMLYADWQKKYGAVPNFNRGTVYDSSGKKVAFAQFPDFQSGREAQRALWSSGAYANMSASQAIAKWSGTKEGSSEHQTYLAKTFGTPSSGGTSNVQLASTGGGAAVGAKLNVASRNAANQAPAGSNQAPVVVDNKTINNTQVASGGGSGGMTAYDMYFGKYLINRTT